MSGPRGDTVAGGSGSAERGDRFTRLGIVGCGLIGGSLALAARERARIDEILLYDRDPAVRREAAARGLGRVVDDPDVVAASVDLAVVAVPIPSISSVVSSFLERMPDRSVLTDVGSVKSRVLVEVEGRVEGSRAQGPVFIGGHPMAGSELDGLAGADGTIFQGATWVLTPTDAPAEAFNRLAAFLRTLGARVLAVDAETHDRVVAITSHLPQLLASTLMRFAGRSARSDPGLLAMAGGGFRDATRVAGSNPELWEGILRENQQALLDALDALTEDLAEVRAAVAAGRWGEVRDLLDAARRARALLPGKEVPEAVVDLVIPIDDRPGALAAVTTALGGVGINIEDLSMRHAEEGSRGALVVAVAGHDTAQRARTILEERGFASHLEPR